jgi:hypothetical protein
MRETKMKGYLYVPASGAPILAFARTLATTAIPVGIRGSERRDPRAVAVCNAGRGAAPGVYKAHVTMREGTVEGFAVTRGPAMRGAVLDEIGRLAAIARRRPEGRVLKASEATAARTARALADALRSYILTMRTPALPRTVHAPRRVGPAQPVRPGPVVAP